MNQEGELVCCAVCKQQTNRRCARCLAIYYCNREHQREDWIRHKSECLPKLTKQSSKKHSQSVPTSSCNVENNKEEIAQCLDKCIHENLKPKEINSKSSLLHKRVGSGSVDSCKEITEILNHNVLKNTFNNIRSTKLSKDGSVISSVVCHNKDLSKQSAITYEGSSEKEILSESAQLLSTVGYMSPTSNPGGDLKTVSESTETKMDVMPSIGPDMSRIGHKEYPEAPLRSNSTFSSYLDTSDPCYEICQRVIIDMTTYGVCVLDNFLGKDRGLQVRKEVLDMYRSGIFTAGQLVSDPGRTGTQSVRSDRITWIDGREPQCPNIGMLINQVDSIILRANKMPKNGTMGDYIINTRTKAMVACYPGSGSNYVKHVDNPNKDGRCITAIYYLNLDWDVRKCGGLLRVFPEGRDQVANIEPIFDRMLFFWSDRRNPHEVQPAFDTRYAITLWYFDAQEREEALRLYKSRASQPSSSK